MALVASTSVGRIAYCTERGAAVLPVNHTVIAGVIVVRITPSGSTAAYLRDHGPEADVTYEVDALDETAGSGWSVVVRGRAQTAPPELLLTAADPPVPWPAGNYWAYVRIHPLRVTGRRLAST